MHTDHTTQLLFNMPFPSKTYSLIVNCGAVMTAMMLAGCVSAPPNPAPDIPVTLQPGKNERVLAILPAVGVQIYECRTKPGGANDHEWAFVAPEADLFDRQGKKIGKHYAGPHWEAADGSRVVASAKARVDSPSPEAIPWLLLTARPAGPNGNFSKVSSILRINTIGGMPPRSGCDASNGGAKARVKYSADYYLFVRTASQRAE